MQNRKPPSFEFGIDVLQVCSLKLFQCFHSYDALLGRRFAPLLGPSRLEKSAIYLFNSVPTLSHWASAPGGARRLVGGFQRPGFADRLGPLGRQVPASHRLTSCLGVQLWDCCVGYRPSLSSDVFLVPADSGLRQLRQTWSALLVSVIDLRKVGYTALDRLQSLTVS